MIKKSLLTSVAVVAASLLLAPGASAADGLTTTPVQHPDRGTQAKDTCQGDSGGPLFHQVGAKAPILIGITSFGISCAMPGLPSIYTLIGSLRDAISGL